jgi:uncharacterized membrane protein
MKINTGNINMNKRITKMGFIAVLVSMATMILLAKWGYVKQTSTVANFYSANAFWNFTFLEMFIGTFLMWPILWLVFYKVFMPNDPKTSSEE